MATLESRGLISRIYVGEHLTLTRDSFKFIFFHYKSIGANDPWGVASLDPRGLSGRIYVGDH